MQISNSSSSFKNLSTDLVAYSLSNLPAEDISSVALVNRSLNKVTKENIVWFSMLTPDAQKMVTKPGNARELFRKSENRLLCHRPISYFYGIGLKSAPTLIFYLKKGFFDSVFESLGIPYSKEKYIANPAIKLFIGNSKALFQKVLKIENDTQFSILLNPEVQQAIKDGTVSFEEALGLPL